MVFPCHKSDKPFPWEFPASFQPWTSLKTSFKDGNNRYDSRIWKPESLGMKLRTTAQKGWESAVPHSASLVPAPDKNWRNARALHALAQPFDLSLILHHSNWWLAHLFYCAPSYDMGCLRQTGKCKDWRLGLASDQKAFRVNFLLGNPDIWRINCANCFREKYLITASKYFPLGSLRAFLVKTEGWNRRVRKIVAL